MSDDTRNFLRALPYVLFPVGIILIIVQETKAKGQMDKELRHHAYNGLGFWAGAFLLSILVWAVSWIPIYGQAVTAIYWLAVLVLAFMYAYRAFYRQPVVVLWVTSFLKKNIKAF